MGKYFFFGKVRPDPKGHVYVTTSSDMRIEGGTKEEHQDAVQITKLVKEGIRMDGIHCAEQILKDAVRKVRG